MKLTNKQIVDSVPALNKLADIKLDVQVAYKVAKNIRALSVLLEDIEKIKNKIVDKWLEKDKEGNPISAEAGKEGAFRLKPDNKLNEELTALFNVENEVHLDLINIKDLKNVEIEPGVLLSIDWMIKQ